MKKSVIRKYAQLAVRAGANLKKGQGCVIGAEVDQHEFAEMVAQEAYRAGAGWVRFDWADQAATKLKYRHETLTRLSKVEEWQKAQLQYDVDNLPARIYISSADPDGLKGINVQKTQNAMAARGKVILPYRKKMDNKHQWTIIAVPSKKWAKKVFPQERPGAAVERLWAAILDTVRVTEDNDPVAAWEAHNAALKAHCEKLNALDLDYLHYKSPRGTDFKCWLIPGAQWHGGGDTLPDGTFFNPNMPTEECFTSPLRGKCEGTLVATMPLSYQGNLIEDFSVTFQDGKVASVKAARNQELLERMVATDEGAGMLGELALVPDDSPISNSGILFYNTLFDENAACHVALGRGFNEVLPGFESMTEEELKEKGINDSMIHVDFMVGGKDLDITGFTRSGKEAPIFRNGNWAI